MPMEVDNLWDQLLYLVEMDDISSDNSDLLVHPEFLSVIECKAA